MAKIFQNWIGLKAYNILHTLSVQCAKIFSLFKSVGWTHIPSVHSLCKVKGTLTLRLLSYVHISEKDIKQPRLRVKISIMSALNESITPSYKDIATLMNHHNYHDIPKIVINGHNDLSCIQMT